MGEGPSTSFHDLYPRVSEVDVPRHVPQNSSLATSFEATGEELHWYVGQQAEALPKVKWVQASEFRRPVPFKTGVSSRL